MFCSYNTSVPIQWNKLLCTTNLGLLDWREEHLSFKADYSHVGIAQYQQLHYEIRGNKYGIVILLKQTIRSDSVKIPAHCKYAL